MSEVFGGLSIWASKRPINFIAARCKLSNIASIKVLINSGFDLIDSEDGLYYWKLKLTENNSSGCFTSSPDFKNTL
jgi:hypothetical protein